VFPAEAEDVRLGERGEYKRSLDFIWTLSLWGVVIGMSVIGLGVLELEIGEVVIPGVLVVGIGLEIIDGALALRLVKVGVIVLAMIGFGVLVLGLGVLEALEIGLEVGVIVLDVLEVLVIGSGFTTIGLEVIGVVGLVFLVIGLGDLILGLGILVVLEVADIERERRLLPLISLNEFEVFGPLLIDVVEWILGRLELLGLVSLVLILTVVGRGVYRLGLGV
jgi:hypothetical protein